MNYRITQMGKNSFYPQYKNIIGMWRDFPCTSDIPHNYDCSIVFDDLKGAKRFIAKNPSPSNNKYYDEYPKYYYD